jgi:hypothetical protein
MAEEKTPEWNRLKLTQLVPNGECSGELGQKKVVDQMESIRDPHGLF